MKPPEKPETPKAKKAHTAQKSPDLPTKLRALADEIDALTEPKKEPTLEELSASVLEQIKPGKFPKAIKAQRKRTAQQTQEDDDSGDGSAGAASSSAMKPARPRPH